MPFEQIPLFEEHHKPGKAPTFETRQEKVTREAAEAKAAFARIQEVIKNTPSWEDLKKGAEAADKGQNRHARKPRPTPEGDAKAGGWLKVHEDAQDARAEQYGKQGQ